MRKQLPEQQNRKRVVPFLIISLLVHLLILTSLIIHQMFSPKTQDLAKKKVESEVQFLDFSKDGRLVDVQESEASKEKPKDSKYLSDKNKLVKKETKAVNHGEFQNKSSKAAQKSVSKDASKAVQQLAKQTAETANAENMKTFSGGDFAVPAKRKEQKATTVSELRPNTMTNMSENAMDVVSQTPDYLKDVAAGAETHLNTSEFLYYSYFNRIRRDLRARWEPLIHEKVKDVIKKGQTRELASTDSKKTSVLFTLDERGVIKRIQVRTTSGLSDLDDAAIEALQAIGQFPHPPKDLVINGIVQIPWTFILES